MAHVHEKAVFAVPLYALEEQINPGYSTITTFERSNVTFALEKAALPLPLVRRAALCCRPSITQEEGEVMHGETVESSLKDKTGRGVTQDRLVCLADSKSFFLLHTKKYCISMNHGPGDGNWGCARCQLH